MSEEEKAAWLEQIKWFEEVELRVKNLEQHVNGLELRERLRQETMETSKKEFQEVLKSRGPLGAVKFLLGDKDNGGTKQIG